MKKQMILVIIIAVVVILLAVGAVLYFVVFAADRESPNVRISVPIGERFVTNVRDSHRLLMTDIELVVDNNRVLTRLEEDNSRIRDTIVFILRDLDEETISAHGTKDMLRLRIVNELNQRLDIENFIEVLFNEFVMA